jgi:uncharacterized membrane protein
VGTYRDGTQKRHGFTWRNGAFTTFNVPDDHPTFGTVALGINDIGEVVGDYVAANDPIPDPPKPPPRHGFLRSSKGVFTTFNVPGAVLRSAKESTTPARLWECTCSPMAARMVLSGPMASS